MRSDNLKINRRDFLRRTVSIGLGAWTAPALASKAFAASRDRVVVFQGVGLDSLHPYAYSGGGIQRHLAARHRAVDRNGTTRERISSRARRVVGIQGNKWLFRRRKKGRFHDGSPFTSKDVLFTPRPNCQRPQKFASLQLHRSHKRRRSGRIHRRHHDQATQRRLARTVEQPFHRQPGRRGKERQPARQLQDRHRPLQDRHLAARRPFGVNAQ